MIIISTTNKMEISLSQFIDIFIDAEQWMPELTDDENIDTIIQCFGSKGNRKVMYWLVKNIIETKINNGEYYCLDTSESDEEVNKYSCSEDEEYDFNDI